MKVLIVDDEMLIRRALGRVFEAKGYKVRLAEDGVEGVSAWKEFQPQLVILDILMPRQTGIEVLKEIGTKHNAKVVLISAYTGHDDTINLNELGVARFIQKPFNDIYKAVEEMESLIK